MPGKLPQQSNGVTGDAAVDAGALGLGAEEPDVDAIDYYRVALDRGDTATLFAFESEAGGAQAELDLHLLDGGGVDVSLGSDWVQDAVDIGAVKQVVAPETGEYWIAVHLASGAATAARYTLTIGVPIGTVARRELVQSRLSTSQRRAFAPSSGAEPVHDALPQGFSADDPYLPLQWQHSSIDLADAWSRSRTAAEAGSLGQNVVVAVLDTGIASEHPDFVRVGGGSQLLPDGYDMILDQDSAGDGDSRDLDPEDPGNPDGPAGETFHGTAVAGTVAAAVGNGEGIVGVAPNARILPVRTVGADGANALDIVDALLYAAGLPNDTGRTPAQRADIVLMSFAALGRSTDVAESVQRVLDEGIIVIASAGNDAAPAEQYSPGGEPGVITVGAVDARLQLAPYSNYSLSDGVIDLTAPGGNLSRDDTLDGLQDGLWSLDYAGDGAELYGFVQGTSMAAAQVAGVAALMKGVWPQMTATQFRQLLSDVVIDLGPSGPDRFFGHGLINAARAVQAAAEAAEAPTVQRAQLHVTPRVFDFGFDYDVLEFDVVNVGDAALVVDEIVANAPWLGVVDDGSGAYRLVLDRWSSDLSPGINQATLSITSNGGSLELPVDVVRSDTAPATDVGSLQVALVDVEASEVVELLAVTADDGYAFEFPSVDPGAYQIVVSTDMSGAVPPRAPAFSAVLPVGDSVLCLGVDDPAYDCADADLEELVATLVSTTD
jgi:serine protease